MSLSVQHSAELETGSAIDPEIIAERGYVTVTFEGDFPTAFADYQRRPGLMIPIRDTTDEVVNYQLKADQPRCDKDGRPIKYDTASGGRQCIDIPPRSRPLLGDPAVPLWITEGAKKVDSGLSHGIGCVVGLQGVYGFRGTNEHGGKKTLADFEDIALNRRDVVLAFDSDCMTKASVRDALERLTALLARRGAIVRFLILPFLADGSKCGLDDAFASGFTRADLEATIVDQLPPIESDGAHDDPPRAVVVGLDDVAPQPVDWLWPHWLARGKLHILGGHAGDGKSTLALALGSVLSRGGVMPDGHRVAASNILLVLAEDDLADSVRPRIDLHDGEPARFATVPVIRAEGRDRAVSLQAHCDELRYVIQDRHIDLVVIDPLTAFMPRTDRNSEGSVRDGLMAFTRMLQETNVAALGIMHVGKASGDGRRPLQMLLGSTGFGALARVVWMVAPIPGDDKEHDGTGRRLLGVTKSNVSLKPPALEWSRDLDAPITWHGQSEHHIDDMLAGSPRDAKREDAKKWLFDQLKSGMMPAVQVQQAAQNSGIADRTLRRAKEELAVQSRRVGFQSPVYWSLPTGNDPDDDNQSPYMANSGLAPVATNGKNGSDPIHGQPDHLASNGKLAILIPYMANPDRPQCATGDDLDEWVTI